MNNNDIPTFKYYCIKTYKICFYIMNFLNAQVENNKIKAYLKVKVYNTF